MFVSFQWVRRGPRTIWHASMWARKPVGRVQMDTRRTRFVGPQDGSLHDEINWVFICFVEFLTSMEVKIIDPLICIFNELVVIRKCVPIFSAFQLPINAFVSKWLCYKMNREGRQVATNRCKKNLF